MKVVRSTNVINFALESFEEVETIIMAVAAASVFSLKAKEDNAEVRQQIRNAMMPAYETISKMFLKSGMRVDPSTIYSLDTHLFPYIGRMYFYFNVMGATAIQPFKFVLQSKETRGISPEISGVIDLDSHTTLHNMI